MHFILIADSYYPEISSGSILLGDLVDELLQHNVQLTLIAPSSKVKQSCLVKISNNFNVIRIKNSDVKNKKRLARGFLELLLPIKIIFFLLFNKKLVTNFDGIIWYSPSIFFGPVVMYLKTIKKVKAYLILRDIFPDWALHTGILKKNIVFNILKFFEIFQYKQADIIGVQTTSNIAYLKPYSLKYNLNLEVLNNWLAKKKLDHPSQIDLSKTALRDRVLFIYAGNIGFAQEIQSLLDVILLLRDHDNIGFVFVGRGSEFESVAQFIKINKLSNFLLLREVKPNELVGLYKQCHAGIVSLKLTHVIDNIPSKFISYINSGLPVFGLLNRKNDLVSIINKFDVGCVVTDNNIDNLCANLLDFSKKIKKKGCYIKRCNYLAKTLFSPKIAAKQVLSHF